MISVVWVEINGNGWATRHCLQAATLTLCLFLPASDPTAQQTPEQEPPTIKVEVRQVLVPVVVTDRQGHHVTGLKAGDFRVFENGVEQRVVSFGTELGEMYPPSSAGVTGSAEPILAPEPHPPQTGVPQPIRRTYLLVLDTLFMSFESSGRIRPAIQHLFKREQGSDSHYALIALGRDLRIIRSVTRKPDEVLAAVESDALVRAIRESGGGSLAGQENQLRTMLEDYCRQCECISNTPPTGRPVYAESFNACESMLNNMERWAASAALERSVATRNFLRRLADIIGGLGQRPGKRILILVSDGFDLRPGRDLYTMIGIYTNKPSFHMRNPAQSLGWELDEVVRTATTANVVVYTVDSRGLPAPTFGLFSAEHQGGRFAKADAGLAVSTMITQMSALENARQDTMARLADVTGGVFFRGNNDIAKGMRQAFADEREYYVLAYASTNRAEDGKFRKIRVELKNKKQMVRAKAGYWAPGRSSSP